MSKTVLIILGVIFVLLVGVGMAFFIMKDSDDAETGTVTKTNSQSTNTESQNSSIQLQFTANIFDPSKVSHITPLGELNGGYEEAQAITSVMVNIKPEAIVGGKEVEVYAPSDMSLESYSYHKVDNGKAANWALIFRINKDTTLKIDHITRAVDTIVQATTSAPKDSSAEENPKSKVNFKAGDVVAYTSGTSLAHNWNIYFNNEKSKNEFVNQARYEKTQTGKKLITADCVFNYYPESQKAAFLALMGYSKAGQSKDCGKVSHDVKGSASGMWHLNKEGTDEKLDGVYASPLSIYKNSAGEIIIDQVDNKRLGVVATSSTNKDPAEITTSHCYQVTNNGANAGYAYVNVVSETEMNFAYSASGERLRSFPTAFAKTYYR